MLCYHFQKEVTLLKTDWDITKQMEISAKKTKIMTNNKE